MTKAHAFWEQAEQVETFASRPPDKRLVELLTSYQHPAQIRVLDLGCAGGRNTLLLAEQGFDVYAIDGSSAMVGKTRERITALLGADEAEKRTQIGIMHDLQNFDAEFFHLLVALGIYHNATSRDEWDKTLEETVRVLKPGGQVLVANFSPCSDPKGEGLRQVGGKEPVYEGFGAGPMFLLDADAQDAEMARVGLLPAIPTETVTVKTDSGQRVTVNALYYRPL